MNKSIRVSIAGLALAAASIAGTVTPALAVDRPAEEMIEATAPGDKGDIKPVIDAIAYFMHIM